MTRTRLVIALGLLLAAALACNTPGASAPTVVLPSQVPVGVTEAATAAPAQPTSAQATAVIPPPIVPPNAPKRISFAAGAISASVQGSVSAGSDAVYLINAGGGQTMTLSLTGTSGQVGLGVTSPAGTVMQDAATGQNSFTGQLPQTGDFVITVRQLGSGLSNFTLQVTIPPLSGSSGGTGNTQCWVTTASALDALLESSPTADKFGTASAGEQTLALARTKDGWLGFDPGVAQAGNQGRARLRWYAPQSAGLTFNPAGCDSKLPLVLSLQSLQNGTYNVLGLGQVTLANGVYTNPNFTTDSKIHDTHMGTALAFGDLNGDGAEDALIVTGTNTGGSGTFVEIWPVLNVSGVGQPGGSLTVGDRTPVNSLSIDANGVITAEVLVDGPNDGACCPSVHQTWMIKLVNGALVKQ